MKSKDQNLRRVNTLFILVFIVVLFFSLFSVFTITLSDFRLEGAKENIVVDGVSKERVVLFYDTYSYNSPAKREVINDSISIYPTEIGAEIIVDDVSELRLKKYNGAYYTFATLKTIVLIGIVVLIVLIFVWFIKGRSNGSPFPHKSIILMRIIIISLIVCKVLFVVTEIYRKLSLEHLFADSFPMRGVAAIGITDFMLLFSAIMITEMMSMASKIYKENELTV